MRNVSLDAIRIDGGTQGRSVIDQSTVYHYRDQMKEGDVFPPLSTVFDGSTYWLVDGFHRYHAYKLLGIKSTDIEYKPGSMEDAQIISYGVNSKHGKPRTNEDKHSIVKSAISNPALKDKSTYELAKICNLSQSFVASVRDPEVKKKQDENKQRHMEKKVQDTSPTSTSSTSSSSSSEPDPYAGQAPDDDEIRASELAMQAYMESIEKVMDSDDLLATANEEIKRLTHLNAQLDLRLHGLMNERNEAVRLVKKLQKENDKLKGKK